MIRNFKCKHTEKLFNNIFVKKFSSIEKQARIKLKYLNAAHNVNDLRVPPGNNLELLKGDLKEFYSIRVNKQWRICFTWKDNAPCDVEIVDYH